MSRPLCPYPQVAVRARAVKRTPRISSARLLIHDHLERTYRGLTSAYQVVHGKLLHAAQSRSHIFYADVADVLGPLGEEEDAASESARLLGEISEDEHAAGRPLLSALVVSGRGVPAASFSLSRASCNVANLARSPILPTR